ncbi:uncharacterized protein LOC134701843 isoform X2 [Mytilus trossulus]|uniref:uncharacterized protein LOC134701843 isoform X2 n=1 Tax=Mytilus trossulus TaxID=6551 RepID=UPI003007A027
MSCRPTSTPFGFHIPEGMKPFPLPLKYDRQYTTSEVRQAWVNARGNEKLGERLSVRQFPISLLRHQVDNRRVHCKSADPHYWMSDEDKRRAADKRKSFERQWSAEVSKRNKTPRPNYTVTIRPPTPPIRKFITAPCVNNGTFFRLADTHRTKTREEKYKSSRHFVSPEWKSEIVSWKRFNNTSIDIHRYSVF